MFEADLYRPPLNDLWTFLLIAGAVCALLWLYLFKQTGAGWFRRIVLIVSRVLAIAVMAWILMGPSSEWGRQVERQRMPILMLADISASMAQDDVPNNFPRENESPDENITRYEALLRTWLEPAYQNELGAVADVSLFAFDNGMLPLQLQELHRQEPEGEGTLLYHSLRQVVDDALHDEADFTSISRDFTRGLVVLMTDGHDTTGQGDGGLAARLKRQGWTVHAVPVGSARGVRDVRVAAWTDADFLFENQSTTINATITQNGFEHRTVRIALLHEGRQIDAQDVHFGSNPSENVYFRITPPKPPARGMQIHGYQVVAQVTPLPGSEQTDEPEEKFTDNNSRWVFVQVSSERIRVAMFEAEPYWDTKFLARVLRSDPKIELTSVYGLASGRTVTVQSHRNPQTGGEEVSEIDFDPDTLLAAKLAEFDVIILGKGMERFFGGSRAQWLVDYVRKDPGGSIIFARGQPFNLTSAVGREAAGYIEPILPVQWGANVYRNLRLKLTDEGRSSPLLGLENLGRADEIVTHMPDMIAATQVQREKALSVVLLRQDVRSRGDSQTPEMAAIVRQDVGGSGRVLAVLTDGMWRWSFLPSSDEKYDSVYQDFWRRAVYWLATGGQFLPGRDMAMTVRLKAKPGEDVPVTITTQFVEGQSFTPRLKIIEPDGTQRDIELMRIGDRARQYQGLIRPEKPGVHQIELTAEDAANSNANAVQNEGDADDDAMKLTARLAVYDHSDERMDTSAQPETLKAITDATGGLCFDLDEREKLPQMLEEMWQARQSDGKLSYIFDRSDIFILILTFFGLEWIIRRRGGMI